MTIVRITVTTTASKRGLTVHGQQCGYICSLTTRLFFFHRAPINISWTGFPWVTVWNAFLCILNNQFSSAAFSMPALDTCRTSYKSANRPSHCMSKYLNVTNQANKPKWNLSSYLDKYHVITIWEVRFGFRILKLLGLCAGRWWTGTAEDQPRVFPSHPSSVLYHKGLCTEGVDPTSSCSIETIWCESLAIWACNSRVLGTQETKKRKV